MEWFAEAFVNLFVPPIVVLGILGVGVRLMREIL